jgi:hypothetical protein
VIIIFTGTYCLVSLCVERKRINRLSKESNNNNNKIIICKKGVAGKHVSIRFAFITEQWASDYEHHTGWCLPPIFRQSRSRREISKNVFTRFFHLIQHFTLEENVCRISFLFFLIKSNGIWHIDLGFPGIKRISRTEIMTLHGAGAIGISYDILQQGLSKEIHKRLHGPAYIGIIIIFN